MIWFTLIMFAVSFFASVFLTPKPNLENARPGKLGDIRWPIADEGSPVPIIFGRVRLRSPNCIWYGNFRTRATKKKVKTGVFSSEKVTTGYRYYVGFHLALCLGPGVKLKKIWCEKKLLYATGVGLGPSPTGFSITKNGIFGGSKRGGGFAGYCTFYGGEFTQARNSYLESAIGADVPGYTGVAHLVFHRPYIGTSPSLRPLSFELERYPDELGLDPGDLEIGEDLNPMEILYAALTEEWGGVGADPSTIDTTSWIAAGATLADEENGMSLIVSAANEAKSIVEEVLRQVDGILYQDPETGKIVVKLIRDDYVVEDLPVFNESNVHAVRDFSRTSWAETINQVRTTFTYRDKKYEKATAFAQDMANINMQGRIRSATVSFPGCTEGPVAVSLATRELSQLSVPLFKSALETNREGSQLRPGDPFVFSWADYNLSNIVMRCQRFNLGELLNGKIVIDVIQDKFAASNTLYTDPEDTLWDEIPRTVVDITDFKAMECPYWVLQQIDDLEIPADSAFWWGLARNPGEMQTYDFVTSDDNFVDDTVVDLDQPNFTHSALLDGDLHANMGQPNGVIDKITIRETDPSPDDYFGWWEEEDILDDTDTNGVREGRNLCVINGELFSYETHTGLGDGVYELETVRRALLDTQFGDHVDGDVIYFLSGLDWFSRNVRSDIQTIYYKFLSYSDQDAQDIDAVVSSNIAANQRYDRPLPPDMLEIESIRCPIEVVGQNTVDITDFYERNRTSPDQVVLVSDSSDTPEGSTTYNARLYLDGVELEEKTALTYGSLPISFTGVEGAGVVRVELEAEVGGLESWSPDFVEFNFAYYQNQTSELVTNGGFESGLTGWTEVGGSWAGEETVYPLDPVPSGTDHAESTNGDLWQDVSIGSYSGDAAVFRAYRGGLNTTTTSQITLELRTGVALLDSITTPLEAPADLGKWDLIEIPVPILSTASILRIKIQSSGTGAAWDNVTFKANTVSTNTATKYDTISGLTVVGAWGLRQLDSGYSGALVKIRDTYDDTETDLYADVDGNLEWWYTKGEARVVVLYDQSGNGAHLEPESDSEQPRLRHSLSETGRPCIDFEGGTESLFDTVASTSRPYMVTRPNCCFAIGPKETTGNDYILTIPHNDAGHVSPYFRWGMVTDSTGWIIGVNGSIGTDPGNNPSNSGKNVWFLDYQQGEAYHNEDTTTVKSWTPADITYPNDTRLRLAETPTGTLEWDGDFHELCIFTGTIAAGDRQTIMESVALYWYNLSV